MERARFERLRGEVSAASAGQALEPEELIQRVVAQQFAASALARRTRQTVMERTCPHCQGNGVVLHGVDQNGRQRFKCRGCRKTYNILTGTPMARARKPEKWGQYLDSMTEHVALRKIVASGIGVHLVTAWRWRHRFLTAAANDNASVLAGLVEADTTFFRRSFKGSRRLNKAQPDGRAVRPSARGAAGCGGSRAPVQVLTALGGGGDVFDAILASPAGIETALEGRIAPGSVLCSAGGAAYAAVADRAEAEHRVVFVAGMMPRAVGLDPDAAPAMKPGRLGLRRVNEHHRRLKYLVNERCRGVATKYLDNYLGWHRAMVRPRFQGKMLLLRSLA